MSTNAIQSWPDADAFLDFTRTVAPVLAKEVFVEKHCFQCDVLDVGCVDHTPDAASDPDWLHKRVRSVARSVLGLDSAAQAVSDLKAQGYNIQAGDIEHLRVGRSFDVIVAGDVIEHLSNPGLFLEGARRHLRKGGRLVVTTPNAFSADQFARAVVANYIAVNPDHTLWLDPAVLWQLGARHGFEPMDFAWLKTRYRISRLARSYKERMVGAACDMLLRRRRIMTQDFGIVLRCR